MAQTSWPFENIDTTEVQFSQWARHINEGVRPDFADELEPFADDSGLNVKVKAGQAMVRGHYYASTAEETLTITTPDATNPRIDSVVLELDIVANSILLKVVAGTPAASPVAPTLTQSEDGNVYQLLLANVAVAAGTFSIEAGDVTDLRTYMFQGVGKWTTATRPANPVDNQTIGYNTDLNTHEVWNGAAWTSVFAPITTEGDLAIGDSTGTAVRLPIGPADTVLTSNGTTATWVEAAGGGGITLVNMPYDVVTSFDFEIPIDSIARFAVVTTSNSPFTIYPFDSSGNELSTFTVDRNNPFSYYTAGTAVASLKFNNTTINEKVILVITDPKSAQDGTAIDLQIITSTQSVTLSTTYNAIVFGAGGAGGGCPNTFEGGGGGGGAGYLVTGSIPAGTYTATIGAGGAGGTGNGANGGNSSIHTLTANGGEGGGAASNSLGGDGGNGGSGGGGGADGSGNFNGGDGGLNGGDGQDGDGTGAQQGAGGTGSGVQLTTAISFPANTILNAIDFYRGGNGGNTRNPGFNGSAGDVTEGGRGATGNNSSLDTYTGGNGGDGYIVLVEAA